MNASWRITLSVPAREKQERSGTAKVLRVFAAPITQSKTLQAINSNRV